MRPILPILMLIAFVGSAILASESWVFSVAFVGQCLGYLIAIAVHLLPNKQWYGLSRKVHYLVAGHTAGLIGTIRYLLGHKDLKPGNSRV